MLESLQHYVAGRSPPQLLRDVVDVLLVYYVLYRLLLVAKGTRAMQVAAGLCVVLLLYLVAQALQLVTVLTLLSSLIQSLPIIVVVVFQNDIRRALQRVGSRAWFGGLARAQESRVIDEVVDAARELARHRIGAIITFEQDANLDEFVGNKGLDIDAMVTAPLLVSIFTPEASNKLHDGSVIIRDLRVAKAGVFFPMPEGRIIDPSFGSRHRAALGITEETDAVVVVVSEERGTISFCFNGNIASDLQATQLREMLESIFSPKVRKKSRKARKRLSEVPPEPVETEATRVSLKGPAPVIEEEPPPSVRRGVRPSDAPPPLRKRGEPEAPLDSDPAATRREPRPMPKAGDLEPRGPESDTESAKRSGSEG